MKIGPAFARLLIGIVRGLRDLSGQFEAAFPYLLSPVPGSPNGANGIFP